MRSQADCLEKWIAQILTETVSSQDPDYHKWKTIMLEVTSPRKQS